MKSMKIQNKYNEEKYKDIIRIHSEFMEIVKTRTWNYTIKLEHLVKLIEELEKSTFAKDYYFQVIRAENKIDFFHYFEEKLYDTYISYLNKD